VHLQHSFTIPAGVEDVWAHFHDISAVAECFPGAKVTSAEGDDFEGTAKVKLGPVALQYSGAGSFIERDESAHRMVFEAKGRDKRGNGTAGATVTMVFADEGGATRTDVTTDLSITGRPAQFGQRMMQEVSDKLLGQFVDCLQHQVGSGVDAPDVVEATEPAPAATTATTPAVPQPETEPTPAGQTTTPPLVPRSGGPGPSTSAPPSSSPSPPAESGDDALDLGTTVLPVIARMYGKQIGVALLVLVVLRWLWGRRR
jgi:uncharacterized protein